MKLYCNKLHYWLLLNILNVIRIITTYGYNRVCMCLWYTHSHSHTHTHIGTHTFTISMAFIHLRHLRYIQFTISFKQKLPYTSIYLYVLLCSINIHLRVLNYNIVHAYKYEYPYLFYTIHILLNTYVCVYDKVLHLVGVAAVMPAHLSCHFRSVISKYYD